MKSDKLYAKLENLNRLLYKATCAILEESHHQLRKLISNLENSNFRLKRTDKQLGKFELAVQRN
jgi:hypothetical protein